MFSLRLILNMSLQMLRRLFPLTHSWGEKENLSIKGSFRGFELTHTQTHSEAELGDVQVELGRVKVNEAEQRSQYPRPALTASAEHVCFCQGAMETLTHITQSLHRAHWTAWHQRKPKRMSSSGQGVHVQPKSQANIPK